MCKFKHIFGMCWRVKSLAMAAGYDHLADVEAVLVIKQPWSDMIRYGVKTMELRSSSLRKYEGQWIGLATSKSNALWGTARISKSTLLNEETMFAPKLLSQHCVTREDLSRIRADRAATGSRSPWKRIYGLSLDGLVTFPQRIPYQHTLGAIGVVRLPDNEVFKRACAHVFAQQKLSTRLHQIGPKGISKKKPPFNKTPCGTRSPLVSYV